MIELLSALLYLHAEGLHGALELLILIKIPYCIFPGGKPLIKGDPDLPSLIIIVFADELLFSAGKLIAIGIYKLSEDAVLIQPLRIRILLFLKLQLLCASLRKLPEHMSYIL